METREKAHEGEADAMAAEDCRSSEEKQATRIKVRSETRAGIGGVGGNGSFYP